jgi:hypothetical protein
MATGKRRHLPLDIEQQITTYGLRGVGAVAIEEYLNNDARYAGRVPTLRTIQRRVKEIRPPDPSGPWSFSDADVDEARLVLPILAAAILDGEGQGITRGEAALIAQIAEACPDLAEQSALNVLYLARLYQARSANKERTNDLDAYLAFAAWRGDEEYATWRYAIDQGWIDDALNTASLFDTLIESIGVVSQSIRSRMSAEEIEREEAHIRRNPKPDVLLSIETEGEES